jgi:hypothetical protein
MPLIKSCSLAAFQHNIAKEIEAGRERGQAYAIALETLKEACKEEGKDYHTVLEEHTKD